MALKPSDKRLNNGKSIFIALSIVYSAALFWCVIPLSGWGGYALEKAKISCIVELEVRNPVKQSFLVTIITTIWIIPLSLIVFLNTKTIKKVYCAFIN